MRTVAVVGVGLIGGSIALALRKAGFSGRIIGVSSPRTVEEALRLKVITAALPLEEAAGQSDLIYLSQPILQILETLRRLDSCIQPGALVTDAGSTKSKIVRTAAEHIRRASFLGGHPMAGKESRGVAAAEADLFVGRPYVLTPVRQDQLDTPAAQEFIGWVRKIGARPIVMPPERHDRVVALASHLPQLASTALAAALSERPELEDVLRTAGPGLADTTRLALSPYEIWAGILATNSGEVEGALDSYIRKLEEIRRGLTGEPVRRQFESAAGVARKLRNGNLAD